jgi:hypothetical protein
MQERWGVATEDTLVSLTLWDRKYFWSHFPTRSLFLMVYPSNQECIT